MSRQLFPLLESSGGGGDNKKTSGLGTYGKLSLALAINFGVLGSTNNFISQYGTGILQSTLAIPNKKQGAKLNSYIGANELS